MDIKFAIDATYALMLLWRLLQKTARRCQHSTRAARGGDLLRNCLEEAYDLS
jgi:hypothetical protein